MGSNRHALEKELEGKRTAVKTKLAAEIAMNEELSIIRELVFSVERAVDDRRLDITIPGVKKAVDLIFEEVHETLKKINPKKNHPPARAVTHLRQQFVDCKPRFELSLLFAYIL